MDTSTHRTDLDPAALRILPAASAGLGELGERLAARHLVADDGLRLLACNWRLSAGELRGELDLIAVDEAGGLVVVCEVKTRRDADRFGGAVAAVSPRKQAKIRALTTAFLRDSELGYRRVRLDLVAVDVGRRPTLTHLQGVL
jgi:putative endonuclease